LGKLFPGTNTLAYFAGGSMTKKSLIVCDTWSVHPCWLTEGAPWWAEACGWSWSWRTRRCSLRRAEHRGWCHIRPPASSRRPWQIPL